MRVASMVTVSPSDRPPLEKWAPKHGFPVCVMPHAWHVLSAGEVRATEHLDRDHTSRDAARGNADGVRWVWSRRGD